MKTKFSAISVSSGLMLLASIGIVSLLPLGCGSRDRSTVESYETSAIQESELTGNSSLRFANRPEANPFEESEKSRIATISNSKTESDSCIAHSDSCVAHTKTAANPFAKITESTELPTLNQTEKPMLVSSPAKNTELAREDNPFAAFDGESKNRNNIGYSNRTNDSESYGIQPIPGVRRGNRTYSSARTKTEEGYENNHKLGRTSTVSGPTLESFRTRWNDRTNPEEESVRYRDAYLNGVNRGMIMDSHRIPRRIEELPNPESKRRRVFSPVPLKKSLQDRLLTEKMKQKHGHLYAELKKANFSDSQIQTIANRMMADEKGGRVETAEHRVEDSKKKRELPTDVRSRK